ERIFWIEILEEADSLFAVCCSRRRGCAKSLSFYANKRTANEQTAKANEKSTHHNNALSDGQGFCPGAADDDVQSIWQHGYTAECGGEQPGLGRDGQRAWASAVGGY